MTIQSGQRHWAPFLPCSERPEPQAFGGAAEDGAHPFPHFACGFVAEGDGQDLAGEGAAGEQDVGEAGGQDAGLAGAGAGQHEHRAVEGFHGFALLVVEAGEVVGDGVGNRGGTEGR